MENYTRLYLIRHGQVKGFEKFTANGHTNVDITEIGVEQMNSLAERLKQEKLEAIYSTGLIRTEKGAKIIGQHHDVPHFTNPELKEIYFGDWEGMTLEDIEKAWPGELTKRFSDIVDYRPSGQGESMRDLSDRVIPGLKKILKEQAGKNILLAAHGGVNRIILCDALKMDIQNMFNIQQDYGCLNIIDYFPDGNSLVRLVNGQG